MNDLDRRCPDCGLNYIYEGHSKTCNWVHDEYAAAYQELAARERAAAVADQMHAVATEDERVKLDAARYRWLRSHPVFQVKELPNELELLDACIDRYMAGKELEE